MALERAEAEEVELAAVRRRSWNKAPGNTHMAHLTMTAWDYHESYKRWRAAYDKVVALRAQLLEMGAP